MKLLDMTSGRKIYTVELVYSILFEAALGLAVSTYPKLEDTLEKPKLYWDTVKAGLSRPLLKEVEYLQRHNTWKIILQLLHEQDFQSLDSFMSYVEALDEVDLRLKALPYVGEFDQGQRMEAIQGDKVIQKLMIESCKEHHFFPQLISFVCTVKIEEVRKHLMNVMSGWYREVLAPDEQQRIAMLERDYKVKCEMKTKLSSVEFVEWATGGVEYQPEPTIKKVILVPHYVYRPWNIHAELEGVKVFYYPIADESIEENIDRYKPSFSLVQHYKILGDENRLRIVKWLFEKDRTLQELTEQLDLVKSTIHHHLTMLKSAHLVKTEGTKYLLNRHSLFLGGKELLYFLEKSNEERERD